MSYGFGAGYSQTPEEEDGDFADEPLNEANMEQKGHKGDEEDDWRHDDSQEPSWAVHRRIGQELDTLAGKPKQIASQRRDEVEDVKSSLSS